MELDIIVGQKLKFDFYLTKDVAFKLKDVIGILKSVNYNEVKNLINENKKKPSPYEIPFLINTPNEIKLNGVSKEYCEKLEKTFYKLLDDFNNSLNGDMIKITVSFWELNSLIILLHSVMCHWRYFTENYILFKECVDKAFEKNFIGDLVEYLIKLEKYLLQRINKVLTDDKTLNKHDIDDLLEYSMQKINRVF